MCSSTDCLTVRRTDASGILTAALMRVRIDFARVDPVMRLHSPVLGVLLVAAGVSGARDSRAGSVQSPAPVARSAAPAAGAPHPRALERMARRAVQRDSTAAFQKRWAARVRANPDDVAGRYVLATLARLTYDYVTADKLYRAIAASAGAPFAIYARIAYGESLIVRNSLVAAKAQLDSAYDAAKAGNARVEQGAALIPLSLARAMLGGPPVALPGLDTARALIGPDPELRALHAIQLASLLSVVGRNDSPDAARRALGLARATRDDWLLGLAFRVVGKDFDLRGRTDSALVYFDSAAAMLRRTRDRSTLALTLMRHAGLLRQRAEYGEAKRLITEARREAELARDSLVIGSASTGLGAIAVTVSDFPAAIAHLGHAITTFDTQRDTLSVALASYYRAMADFGLGNHALARDRLTRAKAIFTRFQDKASVFQAQRSLISIFAVEGRWREADSVLAEARADARRLNRPAWASALDGDEARLALRRGQSGRARILLTRHLRVLAPTDHLQRFDTRARLADAYAAAGDLRLAEREIRGATDALDQYRAATSDRELRMLAFQATLSEREELNESTARVLNALAAGGRAAVAFELAERRRARNLSDELARARALRAGAPDDSTVTKNTLPSPFPVRSLPREVAILEYLTGPRDAPTTAFVVTTGGVQAFSLSPVDRLATDVRRLVTLTEAGEDARTLGRRLGAVLLDKAVAALPATVTNLVIIPDGILHRVPFDVLRVRGGRYLIERYALASAPSAAVVASLWERPRRRGSSARLLAFGDPRFAAEAGGMGAHSSALVDSARLPRLAASGREARRVARYASRSVVRLGEHATADFLKRARLDSFDVVHFATHAVVDDRSAARTFLALAPGGGESGLVSPGDLAALRLDAAMVVLSACRSAGGQIIGGEGVQGLTAPLLQAGARSAVATGWRVNDKSVVRFVDAFYANLAHGLPVAAALREAKLDAIRRGASTSEWAAFSVIGNPLETIPLRVPAAGPAQPWLGLLSALAAALAIYLVIRRRRALDRRSEPSSESALTHH